MFVLIDNYDSFTYNLLHFMGELGAEVVVHRNDKVTADAVIAARPTGIVLSPGPCDPDRAGICLDLVAAAAAAEVPLLGVCLGHQTIGQAFGGQVVRAPAPMHGKISAIRHDGVGVFKDLASPFDATRYHSLMIARERAGGFDGDRRNRGRAGHGPPSQDLADPWRAIPPRKHRLAKRPPAFGQFPGPRRLHRRGHAANRRP